MSVTPPPPGGMPWDPSQGAPMPPAQPLPPQGHGQAYEHGWSPLPPLPPTPQQLPPKKRNVWPVVAIVAVAVLLLGGSVYFALNYLNKDESDPGALNPPGSSASPGSSDEPGGGVEAVDLKNAAVYVKGTLVAFEDGVYEDFTLSDTPPVHTDLDGDGDLDAAAIVDIAGEKPWSQVLLWIWDGTAAQPIAFEASWQWTCDPLTPMTVAAGEGGLALTRSTANVCGGDAATETITVAMRDAFPVEVMGAHHSATTRCRVVPSGATETTDVTGKAEPLVLNAEGAPPLAAAGDYTLVEVHHRPSPDATLDNGYAIATITWADGGTGCGWVPWSAVTG